jgi:hypothetical protein
MNMIYHLRGCDYIQNILLRYVSQSENKLKDRSLFIPEVGTEEIWVG